MTISVLVLSAHDRTLSRKFDSRYRGHDDVLPQRLNLPQDFFSTTMACFLR